MFAMFAVGMGSYGIKFASKLSSMNIFLTTIMMSGFGFITITGCMVVLTYVSLLWSIAISSLLSQVGRIKSLLFLFITNALFSIAFYFSPDMVRPAIFIITSSLFAGNYFVVDTIIMELLPTHIRLNKLGFNNKKLIYCFHLETLVLTFWKQLPR